MTETKFIKHYDWCREFRLRMEVSRGDAPLFCSEQDKINLDNRSRLSPISNMILNTITYDPKNSSFILVFPSITLRPLPLISYIISKKYDTSVFIFSRNNNHYKNYHLLKTDSGFVWYDIPAGKIKGKEIHIKPYVPFARQEFKSQIDARIPLFKNKFFNSSHPKIAFFQKGNLKLTDSITDVYMNKNHIGSVSNEVILGTGSIIFEHFDNYVYSSNSFENFKNWISPLQDRDIKYIFHIANPYLDIIEPLKKEFNAYVLYFPFSFIRTNQEIKRKTEYYYQKLKECRLNVRNIIHTLNIDNEQIFSDDSYEHIQIHNTLYQGNIDRLFAQGMDLYSKLDWRDIDPSFRIHVYKIKQLFFRIYKLFVLPEELSVRYFDEEICSFRYYPLLRYLIFFNKILFSQAHGQSSFILGRILSILYNMINELSECKRFGEEITYSRIGKNYSICELVKRVQREEVIIVAQTGERNKLLERLKKLELAENVRIFTYRKLAKLHREYPNSILVTSGRLLPSHFPIFFKNWKQVKIFTYKGKEHEWVQDQINLLREVDLSQEELSLKYLAEVLKDLLGTGSYKLEKDPLFQSFMEKKKNLLKIAEEKEKELDSEEIFEASSEISTTSITELVYNIMKRTKNYQDTMNEIKIKRSINRIEQQKEKSYIEQHSDIQCVVLLQNEMSGEELHTNLDINKRYLCFTNRDNVNIKSVIPYALHNGNYIILFGERQKLSLSDFTKETFDIEEDFDSALINEWHERLVSYFIRNYRTIKSFYRDFINKTDSTISYGEFGNWVRGNVNYVLDPNHLYNLGQLMNDSFFCDNYLLICEEGKKIQAFNLNLTKKLKKLVVKILSGDVFRSECSLDELELLDQIENCIYKIKDIKIKK